MMKTATLLITSLFASAVAQADWPRFRGANGAGEAADVKLPDDWSGESAKWSADLPGEGHSSPVVIGGRIFVTCAEGKGAERHLLCFDLKTGKEQWRKSINSESHKRHKMNSFATSTPAADSDHVYVLWGQPGSILVIAYSHGGDEVWRADLGKYKSGHGYGPSPIVADGKLIVANDQEGDNSIIALDCKSGEEVWRTPRSAMRATYSTPCVYPHDNGLVDVIVSDWQQGLTALDLATGKPRWDEVVFDVDDKQRAIGSPIVWDDLVIGSCGFVTGKKRLVALRIGAPGKKPQKVFQLDRGVPHVPTSVAHDGRLYMWADTGMVTCVKLPEGKVLYDRERVPARGKVFSSPIAVGDKIVNFTEQGEVVVLQAGDEFKVAAEGKLPEGTLATPAMADGRLILRTKSKLFVW